ncbi:WSC domain-containing protein [Cercophora samala]|uniref:WSC domain-containing protein n=1 Tax=Cercophora samala TaxID=330535 RepID=A0AA40D2B5_9PEZI|nr:WSC domain-containing protein [Cercophora samala]
MAFTHSTLRLLLLFFSASSALPSKHLTRQVGSSYTSLGCFKDNEGGQRALTGGSYAADDMTVANCSSFCSKFELFAVSYGRECYCGQSVTEGNTEVGAADCSFPCAGNPDEKCGAGNRINLYTNDNPSIRGPAALPGITSLGCFVDTAARVLPNNIIGADDMTAAKCAENCADYDFFGTQWSRECFCGSILPTEPAPSSDCSMPCAGDDNELCGAGMRLNVYSFDKEPTTVTTTTTSDPTSSPTSEPATPVTTIDGFEYQGCYTDNVPQRVLGGKVVVDGAMTLEKCASSCKEGGYALFGVQYNSECFCGTSLDAASVLVSETECAMACSGDPLQKCGAGNRLSLYSDPTIEQTEATNLDSIGEFSYRSCWTDDVANRSLAALEHRTDNMTVAKCADICQEYAYFGVEYGRECYCGDDLVGQAALEKDCSVLCVGGGNNWCGGPFRLNLYAKEAVPATTSTTVSETSTTSEVESTTLSEPTSTASDISAVTDAPETLTTTTEETSTTTEESTTSTEEPALSEEDVTSTEEETTTTEEPTSSSTEESTTTSIVEASTTVEPSTTSDTVSSTTSLVSSTSLPSATIASSTTTTQGPSSVTITRCPPTPTWVGRPEMCYDTSLPPPCEQLASTLWQPQAMSGYLFNCHNQLTRYGLQPNPVTCFPTSTATNPPDAAAATSTIRSVHSCLGSAYLCTKTMACETSTYPVGQVPVPTQSVGVETLSDGGFESGQWGNWTLTGDTTRMTGQVSSLLAKTGSYSYFVHNPNYSSAALVLSRTIAVEPGKYYRFKANVWISNNQVSNSIHMNVFPAGFGQQFPQRYNTAGVWREIAVQFTTTSSWLEIQLVVVAQPVYNYNPQQWEGQNNIFIDDISLVRLGY